MHLTGTHSTTIYAFLARERESERARERESERARERAREREREREKQESRSDSIFKKTVEQYAFESKFSFCSMVSISTVIIEKNKRRVHQSSLMFIIATVQYIGY